MTTKNQKLHQDHNTSAVCKTYAKASHWTNKGIKKRRCQSTPLSPLNQEIKQQSRIQCENRRTKSQLLGNAQHYHRTVLKDEHV